MEWFANESAGLERAVFSRLFARCMPALVMYRFARKWRMGWSCRGDGWLPEVSRCTGVWYRLFQNGTVGRVFWLKWRVWVEHNVQVATLPSLLRRGWCTHPAH